MPAVSHAILAMQIRRLIPLFAATLVVLACSTTTSSEYATIDASRADTVSAAYGEIAPRIIALDAMAGRRPPVVLRMERFSVEGTRIIYYLAADSGRATFTVDEREDGGGIRTYTLPTVMLVRLEPSVWIDNVEVRKERFVAVDPTSPGSGGPFLLVEPACLTGVCYVAF